MDYVFCVIEEMMGSEAWMGKISWNETWLFPEIWEVTFSTWGNGVPSLSTWWWVGLCQYLYLETEEWLADSNVIQNPVWPCWVHKNYIHTYVRTVHRGHWYEKLKGQYSSTYVRSWGEHSLHPYIHPYVGSQAAFKGGEDSWHCSPPLNLNTLHDVMCVELDNFKVDTLCSPSM